MNAKEGSARPAALGRGLDTLMGNEEERDAPSAAETPDGPVSIEELISLAGEEDIILIEGFKHEGSFPRIEVRRREAANEPPLAERGGLQNPPVAVATDFDEPGFEGIPRLSLNDPQAVADFIEELMSGALAKGKL